jgi:anti-sigma B factor antagonist
MGAARHKGMVRLGERVERSSGAAPPLSSGAGGEPEDGQSLSLQIEPIGTGACVVSLAGELDLSTIPRVEKQLFEQVRLKEGVIVDLTSVSFIDSSGIAVLIKAFRATDDAGILNTVIAEGSQVERVFRLAGIDQALPIFMARAHAVDALNGSASA